MDRLYLNIAHLQVGVPSGSPSQVRFLPSHSISERDGWFTYRRETEREVRNHSQDIPRILSGYSQYTTACTYVLSISSGLGAILSSIAQFSSDPSGCFTLFKLSDA